MLVKLRGMVGGLSFLAGLREGLPEAKLLISELV